MPAPEPLPPHLRVIGDEWRARSRDLAEWGLDRLVNRKDVWGQYTSLAKHERENSKKTYKALTLPQKSMRGQDMVTLEKLDRHFGSLKRHHLIGLHAKSEANTSRWFAIDLDLHDPDAVDAEDSARRNFAAALGWWEALQSRGYDPLLIDSNGAGGFHLWTLLAEPCPSRDVYAFVQEIIADWEPRNLDEAPETFPKSAHSEGEKLGAWLRLPGLHHTNHHFSRVWSGEEWLEFPWLEGDAAIEVMLNAVPGPPVPKLAPDAEVPKAARPAKRPDFSHSAEPKSRSVCVDLDGVLAEFDRWRGIEHFGKPIDGAVEFTRELAEDYRILIFSARTASKENVERSTELVAEWLDTHGFAWDEIYTGQGKPFATAYVDDRGVSCRPMDDGPTAFEVARKAIDRLK